MGTVGGVVVGIVVGSVVAAVLSFGSVGWVSCGSTEQAPKRTAAAMTTQRSRKRLAFIPLPPCKMPVAFSCTTRISCIGYFVNTLYKVGSLCIAKTSRKVFLAAGQC